MALVKEVGVCQRLCTMSPTSRSQGRHLIVTWSLSIMRPEQSSCKAETPLPISVTMCRIFAEDHGVMNSTSLGSYCPEQASTHENSFELGA